MLHDVHRFTKLPKPTLLRILHTLEQAGVVSRRRLADGHYRISANQSHLTRKPDRYDRVAEAAAPFTVLRRSTKTEDRLARDAKRFHRILAETRVNGYGTRDQSFIGGAYGSHSPDGLAEIAVPLLDGRRVHGVINIIWAKAARKVDDIVQDHLADLQNAATEIVGSLRDQTGLRRVSGTEI